MLGNKRYRIESPVSHTQDTLSMTVDYIYTDQLIPITVRIYNHNTDVLYAYVYDPPLIEISKAATWYTNKHRRPYWLDYYGLKLQDGMMSMGDFRTDLINHFEMGAIVWLANPEDVLALTTGRTVTLYLASNHETAVQQYFHITTDTVKYVPHETLKDVEFFRRIAIFQGTSGIDSVTMNNMVQAIGSIRIKVESALTKYPQIVSLTEWKTLVNYLNTYK